MKTRRAQSLTEAATVLVLRERGKYGDCGCGGAVFFYSDYGVRCESCSRLYGTWVEDLKKAKEDEKQRKEEVARLAQIRKFDEEVSI